MRNFFLRKKLYVLTFLALMFTMDLVFTSKGNEVLTLLSFFILILSMIYYKVSFYWFLIIGLFLTVLLLPLLLTGSDSLATKLASWSFMFLFIGTLAKLVKNDK